MFFFSLTMTNSMHRDTTSTGSPPSSSAPSSKSTAKKTPTSNKESDHQNEGFIKSTWHKITGQHDHLQADSPSDSKPVDAEKKDQDEPKKASGSGS